MSFLVNKIATLLAIFQLSKVCHVLIEIPINPKQLKKRLIFIRRLRHNNEV